jgi:predicted AAA+ superfamily ATPase
LIDNSMYNRVKGLHHDKGKLFENQIFRDLIRQNRNIFFYKNQSSKVDFIDNATAIQVCYSLTRENQTRELSGLEAASQLPGIKEFRLIINESEVSIDHPFIEVIPYWQTVLKNNSNFR